jgi:hypothetical protein
LRRKIGPNSGLLEGRWKESKFDESKDKRKVRPIRGKKGQKSGLLERRWRKVRSMKWKI